MKIQNETKKDKIKLKRSKRIYILKNGILHFSTNDIQIFEVCLNDNFFHSVCFLSVRYIIFYTWQSKIQ